MSDLIAFVKARLDEDQKTATAAAELCGCHPPAPVWTHIEDPNDGDRIVIENDPHGHQVKRKLARKWCRTYQDLFHGRHIARHDPKAVLADIAFKRDLLELFAISNEEGFGGSEGWVMIRDAVYQLAALWSDHEDYNPGWRTRSTADDTSKFATGGLAEGPPTPITIDLRHEQVITADEARKDPRVRAALQKLTQERADPRRAAQAAADAIKESD